MCHRALRCFVIQTMQTINFRNGLQACFVLKMEDRFPRFQAIPHPSAVAGPEAQTFVCIRMCIRIGLSGRVCGQASLHVLQGGEDS